MDELLEKKIAEAFREEARRKSPKDPPIISLDPEHSDPAQGKELMARARTGTKDEVTASLEKGAKPNDFLTMDKESRMQSALDCAREREDDEGHLIAAMLHDHYDARTASDILQSLGVKKSPSYIVGPVS